MLSGRSRPNPIDAGGISSQIVYFIMQQTPSIKKIT